MINLSSETVKISRFLPVSREIYSKIASIAELIINVVKIPTITSQKMCLIIRGVLLSFLIIESMSFSTNSFFYLLESLLLVVELVCSICCLIIKLG